jgi:hypothetical protein
VRFLPIAALFHGQTLSVASLARDAEVSRTTVAGYLDILDDTLLTFRLPAWEGRLRVRERRHPKLYWVDARLVRAIRRQREARAPDEEGPLFDAGARAGLLHDRLRLLADGVRARLEEQLETPVLLDADAVGAATPAGCLQGLLRVGGIERPAEVGRDDGRGPVQDVPGGAAETPVDLRGDRRAVDQESERPADERVAEDRMWRLRARPLAVDLAPGIAQIQEDVLDLRASSNGFAGIVVNGSQLSVYPAATVTASNNGGAGLGGVGLFLANGGFVTIP